MGAAQVSQVMEAVYMLQAPPQPASTLTITQPCVHPLFVSIHCVVSLVRDGLIDPLWRASQKWLLPANPSLLVPRRRCCHTLGTAFHLALHLSPCSGDIPSQVDNWAYLTAGGASVNSDRHFISCPDARNAPKTHDGKEASWHTCCCLLFQ